jgi:hypothetical protein
MLERDSVLIPQYVQDPQRDDVLEGVNSAERHAPILFGVARAIKIGLVLIPKL